MKKVFLIAILTILLGAYHNAAGQELERQRIAVFDPASSGTSIDDGTKIAVREIISSTIVNTGKYSIVERSLLEKVMEEQKFSNSGAVDDMQATEIGKLAGANKVVLSVVTLTGGRNMLSIKIIDVMTATIERQKVKVVTSGELLDVIEPLTLEMLNITSSSNTSIVSSSQPTGHVEQPNNKVASAPQYIPTGELFMYGVDFSRVQIYGAKETAQQFSDAFIAINEIFTSEPDKFDFSKFSSKPCVTYTNPTDKLISTINWQYTMSSNGVPQKHPIENIVKNYQLPHKEGVGLVFIAWLLDKSKASAHYDVVYFDIKTRRIIFNTTVVAEAGGMSLRNFWANSIYNVIDQKKLRKQIELVL